MPVTRRELCSMLPAVLIPAILPSEASAAQEDSMPSAVYPFEKLPVRTPNGAEIRAVPEGQARHGRIAGGSRDDASARRHAPPHTITCIPKCGSFAKEPWSSPSMEPATGLARLGRVRAFE